VKKESQGRHRHRWKDNIKLDDLEKQNIREWDCVPLAQDRVQWCEHSNETLGSIKDSRFLD
jgi:hypothetical protein